MNATGLQSADKPHAIIEPWAFIEANWRPKSLTNKLTDNRNPLATIKTALKFCSPDSLALFIGIPRAKNIMISP